MLQSSVNARHHARIKYIKAAMTDYTLVELWEHDFDNMCSNDLRFMDFLESHEITEQINLREALFGGRTNALRLYYNCAPGEKIMYYDYTSLYPFVQKY